MKTDFNCFHQFKFCGFVFQSIGARERKIQKVKKNIMYHVLNKSNSNCLNKILLIFRSDQSLIQIVIIRSFLAQPFTFFKIGCKMLSFIRIFICSMNNIPVFINVWSRWEKKAVAAQIGKECYKKVVTKLWKREKKILTNSVIEINAAYLWRSFEWTSHFVYVWMNFNSLSQNIHKNANFVLFVQCWCNRLRMDTFSNDQFLFGPLLGLITWTKWMKLI